MNWLKWFKQYRECALPPERFKGFSAFKDERTNQRFSELGYTIVKTGKAELFQKIRSEFDASVKDVIATSGSGFINTSELPAGDAKAEQTRLIQNYASQIFDGIFNWEVDIQPEVFFVKPPMGESEVAMHQDALIVDEHAKVGFHCWIPLQPSTIENGGLQVIPGSHKINNRHRAYSIPWRFAGQEKVLADSLMPVELELGDVLIYDRSLIHYSPANRSDKPRVAMAYSIAERPLQFLHLVPNSEQPNMIDFYEVSSDFLMNEDPFSAPKNAKPVKSEKLENDRFSDWQLKQMLARIESSLAKLQ